MMKHIDRNTTTYDVGDGFYVDIVSIPEKDLLLEAWIYHEDYGIKELMFAVEHETIETLVDMVNDKIAEYVEDFCESNMD